MIKTWLFAVAITIFLLLTAGRSLSQPQTIPGEISAPYPTLINLGIEWPIQGDDNQNGEVKVMFREKGKSVWREGMPLRRTPAGENMSALTLERETPGFFGFTWENKFAGSLFDLSPGTSYDIRLQLVDPDGGSAEKTITAKTRSVPSYEHAEVIDIAPGVYDTLHCKSGSPENPVLYRCKKGKALFTHINMKNNKWTYVDGLQITNRKENGQAINLSGSENCAVSYCLINAVWGIVAYKPGAVNGYFADNIITGTTEWTNEAMGAHGKNVGEGIEITGPGNVICFNTVKNFRDCISTMEDEHVVNQTGIDIYNNDIYNAGDDGIEADFCFSNCRIVRNRITNCFVGLSSQPALGGPVYFIRNAMYNIVHAAFKLKRNSKGNLVMHNTVIKIGAGLGGNSAMDYAYFRNNIAIGGISGSVNWGDYGAGTPSAAEIPEPGKHSSFDYDAVGVSGIPYTATIGDSSFSRVEKHGIEKLSLQETFTHVSFPYPPVPERSPVDLRPKKGSLVEDRALRIPNVNDSFSGKGPDRGAYEIGQPMPHYGTRKR